VAALMADVNSFARAIAAIGVFLIALLAIGFVRRDEINFVLRSVLPNGSQ
jgi:hypothetical protein